MDVNIFLDKKEVLINEYNQEELNKELGEYIYNKAVIGRINNNQFFRINITTNFEVKNRGEIVDMIRSYYGFQIKEEFIYLKRSYIKNLILFVIGIILLMAAYFIENITNFILPEIFIIIGWLAIWEMAYGFLFSNGKHRLKIRLLKKLTKCKIIINEE